MPAEQMKAMFDVGVLDVCCRSVVGRGEREGERKGDRGVERRGPGDSASRRPRA